MNRREMMRLVAGVGAALGVWSGCRWHARGRLARLLGLRHEEEQWLASLTPTQVNDLERALAVDGGRATDRDVLFMAFLLGPRSRLFAYVGYPPLPDSQSACNGLIRE